MSHPPTCVYRCRGTCGITLFSSLSSILLQEQVHHRLSSPKGASWWPSPCQSVRSTSTFIAFYGTDMSLFIQSVPYWTDICYSQLFHYSNDKVNILWTSLYVLPGVFQIKWITGISGKGSLIGLLRKSILPFLGWSLWKGHYAQTLEQTLQVRDALLKVMTFTYEFIWNLLHNSEERTYFLSCDQVPSKVGQWWEPWVFLVLDQWVLVSWDLR